MTPAQAVELLKLLRKRAKETKTFILDEIEEDEVVKAPENYDYCC